MSDIVNKKTTEKLASALKYDKDVDDAPYVVALGQGKIAEKIIETGHQHGVKVVEDKSLSTMLQNLSIGDEIPEELYHVVAQVLVFISELDNEFANRIIDQRYQQYK
ncbi:MAG: EscU/YscU/HrcU family type III secretion system export apparatus switch protein [Clostridiales bacterium]|nr:EscU/YscU/HrcU family type III secretion system export apparatus switch protein [Clostridiales bacterium]